MKSPFITKLAQALYRAAHGKSKAEIGAIAERAIAFLQAKRVLSRKNELFEALEQTRLQEQGSVRAQVSAMRKLTLGEQRGIKDFLKKYEKREIELEVIVDPAITGGFRVLIGDTLIDATVDQHIKKLAQALIR